MVRVVITSPLFPIKRKSNLNQWHYVPTKQNAARHGTGGLTVSKLADTEMWRSGMSFLALPECDCPEERSSKPPGVWTDVKAEQRQIMQADEEANRSRKQNRTAQLSRSLKRRIGV